MKSMSTEEVILIGRVMMVINMAENKRKHKDVIRRLSILVIVDWKLKSHTDNTDLLEAVLDDFPMSASERWMGFLVW